MVIIVGNKLKLGGFLEVIENRLNDEVVFIEENASILRQENDILAISKDKRVEYIIYDVEQYLNETNVIIDTIKRIEKVNSSKIILYVVTDNPKSEMIKCAVERDIRHFINKNKSMSMQKDEFEKIVVGYYDVHKKEEIKAVEKEIENKNRTLNEFVEELYDAKQREEEKENTIIIKKKRNLEVILSFIIGVIKSVFAVLSILLMSIAIIGLIYEKPRIAIFEVLNDIYNQVIGMF